MSKDGKHLYYYQGDRVRKATYSTELSPRDSLPILDIDRKFISYSQHFADLFDADICIFQNLELVTFLALNFIVLLKYFMNELAFDSSLSNTHYFWIYIEMKKQLASKL